jgi:hypothetical protein
MKEKKTMSHHLGKDEIIRMAREAGYNPAQFTSQSTLERFAALVAAHEREACAMEADYEAARWPYAPECREPCEEIAKAIRARG